MHPIPTKRPPDSRLNYTALNDTTRYTMWSVFRVQPGRLGEDRAGVAEQAGEFVAALAGKGVVVRGVYDLAGLRAGADYLIWWHAAELEPLQAAYTELRRDTALGRASVPVWSQVAVHRPAEFNKSHIPAFLADEQARRYLCVYPFVRSREWYLMPGQQRRRLLAEHGQMARNYPDVRANTVSSFGLGDYEWILAFEADELHRIVDLMAHLRGSDTRRYVHDEVPFYTGPRLDIAELVTALARDT
jgi:chlorite dismutase